MLHNLLESAELLAEACRSFTERCVRGIAAEREPHPRASRRLADAGDGASPHIGYEKSAEIALSAHHQGISLRAAALKLGYVSEAEFDEWVRPEEMTGPTG